MPDYVWGRNPVLETLRSSRKVKRVLVAEGQREASALADILQEVAQQQIPVETVPRQQDAGATLGVRSDNRRGKGNFTLGGVPPPPPFL